jgi:O-glycosyl hydrolase
MLNTSKRLSSGYARNAAWRWSSLALFAICIGCIDQPRTGNRDDSNSNGGKAGSGEGGQVSGVDGAGTSGSAGLGGDVGGAPSDGTAGAAGDAGSAGNPDSAGGTGGAHDTSSAGTAAVDSEPAETVVKVSYGTTHQQIDGFGVATAWGAMPATSQLDAFFSVSKGAGLSILRNRIPFRESPVHNDNFMGGGNYDFTTSGTEGDGYKTFKLNWNNWDLSATRMLIAALKANPDYQVPTYFSTPWTPPNNDTSRWKLGVADYVNAPEVGGYLDPAHYQDYADLLADYVLGFANKMGAPLAALSLQNEPNYRASYESADWSAEQIHSFLTVLRSEFEKKGVFSALPGLTILAPEAATYSEALILPSLADSNTASLIGIVGAHQYDFGPWNVASYAPKPLINSLAAGKRVWVTEWNTSAFKAETPLATALLLAGLIQADLTTARVSAYVHWWHKDLVDDAGLPNKNLFAIGHFSRFVRPGFSRVEAPIRVGNDLLLAAFKDAPGTELALVAINRGSADSTFAIELDAGTLGGVSTFRTSATEDLASVGSAPSGGSFANVTAKAQSITTFVMPVLP